MNPVALIFCAAGKDKRMASDMPKSRQSPGLVGAPKHDLGPEGAFSLAEAPDFGGIERPTLVACGTAHCACHAANAGIDSPDGVDLILDIRDDCAIDRDGHEPPATFGDLIALARAHHGAGA